MTVQFKSDGLRHLHSAMLANAKFTAQLFSPSIRFTTKCINFPPLLAALRFGSVSGWNSIVHRERDCRIRTYPVIDSLRLSKLHSKRFTRSCVSSPDRIQYALPSASICSWDVCFHQDWAIWGRWCIKCQSTSWWFHLGNSSGSDSSLRLRCEGKRKDSSARGEENEWRIDSKTCYQRMLSWPQMLSAALVALNR